MSCDDCRVRSGQPTKGFDGLQQLPRGFGITQCMRPYGAERMALSQDGEFRAVPSRFSYLQSAALTAAAFPP
jgi:hypothetical protein